jgi:hypothetical protein
MKKYLDRGVVVVMVAALSLISATSTFASTPNGTTTKVVGLLTWAQAGAAGVIVQFQDGHDCLFNSEGQNGKTLLTMATSALLSSRDVRVWCSDTIVTYAGHQTRNLERLDLR